MTNFGFEPTADAREFALATRQLFIAWMQQGFSEDQAMQMLCTCISANQGK